MFILVFCILFFLPVSTSFNTFLLKIMNFYQICQTHIVGPNPTPTVALPLANIDHCSFLEKIVMNSPNCSDNLLEALSVVMVVCILV